MEPVDKQGQTALIWAARYNQPAIIQPLIASGANLNAQTLNTVIEGEFRYGKQRTALMYAAKKGHIDILKALLTAGADPDIRDKDGFTALMLAVIKGQVESVKVLISTGADIEQENSGKRAIHYAEYDVACFNALLEAGSSRDQDVQDALIRFEELREMLSL